MRNAAHPVWNIYRKEFRSFFNSAVGYIILSLFFVGAALLLWVFPGEYNVFDGGYANIDGLFVLAPWLFLFLCPAVTMRLLAEERQQGTLELLITRPISKTGIVLGKFAAAWSICAVALLPALLWFGCVYLLAEPMGNVDIGAFLGSFFGLLLIAALYSAVGLFGSSLTNNQITAFVVSAVVCFLLFYGFEMLGSLLGNANVALYIKNLGIDAHYTSMSRGVLDSRDIIYMFAATAIFLISTIKRLNK